MTSPGSAHSSGSAPATGSVRVDWLTIALRNIWKNGRRSAFTITAIAFGFAAINLFGGFTRYIFSSVKETQIYLTGNGHLTVFKAGYNPGYLMSSQAQLLTTGEVGVVREMCTGDPRFLVVTPKLVFMGLLSNGEESTPFLGIGKVVPEVNRIYSMASGRLARMIIPHAETLAREAARASAAPPPSAVPPPSVASRAPHAKTRRHEIVLARGLAGKLHLKVGAAVTALATTLDGQMNALDADVGAVMDVALEMLDYMVVEAPLTFAQELYDTDRADRIVILLERDVDVVQVRDELQRRLGEKKLPLTVKVWYEIDHTSEKVEEMLRVIFLFLFTIFLIIALMSVANTVGMSVSERTREIGTLRALGVRRRGIITMIACESMLLGALGSLCGVALTLFGALVVRIVDPHWTPPQVPMAIPIEIQLVPRDMALTCAALVIFSLLVGYLPARRAAHASIVDALGHV